jgi:hypothetical protein
MPVNPGPFQTIVEVGWNSKPTLLILRFVCNRPYSNEVLLNNVQGFEFAARIESDLPGGVVKYGLTVDGPFHWPFNDVPFGKHATKTAFPLLADPYQTAIAMDLRAVREAFALAEPGTGGAVAAPTQIRIIVSAFFQASDVTSVREPLEITALLYKGVAAEYVMLQPGLNRWDFSALNVSPSFLERPISTLLEQATAPVPLVEDFPVETLIVNLEEMEMNWEADLT